MHSPLPLDYLSDWPRAHGRPVMRAEFKQDPEDFRVEEILGFVPSGAGEHMLLQVRKTGWNTEALVRELARRAGVRPRDVGYCGLKDRQSVATQWFSVPQALTDTRDWPVGPVAGLDSVVIQQGARHHRKLRRGTHRGNRFVVTLRDVGGRRDAVTSRLARLRARGVPNYFGEQRFGRGRRNLLPPARQRRAQQRRCLSATRAYLFNTLLAHRVLARQWAQPLPGDVLMLDGTRSVFRPDVLDETLHARVARGELHPTGPLPGRGGLVVTGAPAHYEERVAQRYAKLAAITTRVAVDMHRRALRLNLPDLEEAWRDGDATLQLTFSLPAGAFATAVLHELAVLLPPERSR